MAAPAPRFPSFVVIGAAKSGTTALYHLLRQHPQVFMSRVKEPGFFAFDETRPSFSGPHQDSLVNARFVWRLDEYLDLFRSAGNARALGEVTPYYLVSPRAAPSLKTHVEGVRLVALLRHPVERAYSHYLMLVRDGHEPLSFEEALAAEPARTAANWYWGRYREHGYYHRHLRRYFDLFPREHIRVYLYDDFRRDPLGLLRDLFEFLGVDSNVAIDTSARHNVSGVLRNPVWRLLWSRSNSIRALIRPLLPRALRRRVAAFFETRPMLKPPMSDETRRELLAGYRDDILKLQDLIGRDLSAWLR